MKELLSLAAVFALAAAAAAEGPPAGEPPQNSPGGGSASAALPPDVYSDSLARLPVVKREELDDYGKRIYDLYTGPQTRSLLGLRGPLGMWLYSPNVADGLRLANEHLRYETPLGRRLTELAILVTARELSNQFEWTAHEPVALKEGLEAGIVEVVKHRKDVAGLGEKETVVILFGRELFGQRKVSSETFARALALFGKRGVVDLSALMGYYSFVATTINAFDLQLAPGQKPLLPAD